MTEVIGLPVITENTRPEKSITRLLLSEEFECKNENLSVNNPIIEPQLQIEVSVRKNLHKMKKGKTSGTSGVVLLLSFGDVDIERLKNLFDKIIAENKVLQVSL